ncbi:65-kDa microtubule-associated protein 1-like [Daucus carota subsp. sativus]|uniref:65-kDa microtubule-associated protein 1-like n=1 Tax=Daucus carota subsp. sativus TaxID=79200 RepID=UPI003083AE3A
MQKQNLVDTCSNPAGWQPDKSPGTIKKQLSPVAPVLEQVWKQKGKRIKELSYVQSQIQIIYGEIAVTVEHVGNPEIDESVLLPKKLEEFHVQLRQLPKEKSERLKKVLELVSTIHDLCAVRGIDFFSTVTEVHPSLNYSSGLQSKGINNDTLSRLATTVSALQEDKQQR